MSASAKRFRRALASMEKEFAALEEENTRLRQLLEAHGIDINEAIQETVGATAEGDEPKRIISMSDPAPEDDNDDGAVEPRKDKHKGKTNTSKSKHTPTEIRAPLKELSGHRDGIWNLAISRAGGEQLYLGTASADGTARLWQVDESLYARGKKHEAVASFVYTAHKGSVNSIAFSSAAPLACTASGDSTCHIWRVPTTTSPMGGSGAANVDVPAGGSAGISWSPLLQEKTESSLKIGTPSSQRGDRRSYDGRSLSTEHHVDDTSPTPIRQPLVELKGHTGVVLCAEWTGSGDVVSGGWDRTCKLWSVDGGRAKLLSTWTGHENFVTCLAPHPVAPETVASSGADGTWRQWDTRTGTSNVVRDGPDAVTSIIFSPDGNSVVTTGDDRTVKIWDVRHLKSATSVLRMSNAPTRVAYHTRPNRLAVAQENGEVRVYTLEGEKVAYMTGGKRGEPGHKRTVTGVAWHEQYLFSASFDRTVMVWQPPLNFGN